VKKTLNLYVAVPIPRESMEPCQRVLLQFLYGQLKRFASLRNIKIHLPSVDPSLEKLDLGAFSLAIYQRIEQADGIITVCYPPSASVACEAQHASTLGKTQVLLVADEHQTSRLLKALPKIVATISLPDVDFEKLFAEFL
jgi:hypothetical protein